MNAKEALIDPLRKVNTCPEFPHFGATYPDATCIDGYLWDLDSFEDGYLTQGGEESCPFCNTKLVVEQGVDEESGITEAMIIEVIEQLRVKYTYSHS